MNLSDTSIEKLLKTNNLQRKSIIISNAKTIIRPEFYLNDNIGNNTFAYFANKKIYVPAIITGDFLDIKLGQEIVFTDLVDQKIASSIGLEKYIWGKTAKTNTPIFICDNHNQVLESWYLLKNERKILVHIDQHKDENIFTADINNWRKNTKIADYINFAKQANWINNLHYSFTESKDWLKLPQILQDLKNLSNYPIILNIDLDFFAPEFNLISLADKINLIKAFVPYAKIITIATSPLFIEQTKAIRIGKLFWQYL